MRWAHCTTSAATARTFNPIHERQLFGRSIFIFDGADRARLAEMGEVRTPSLADVFVAVMGPPGSGTTERAA